MSAATIDLLTPRLLVVDDERQIHASIRLRLGKDCELVSCYSPAEALKRVQHERFDLCIVDIHMPEMDGLEFIEAARGRDPELGYVVVSAFDTEENLRRAIPLQVYDFIPKPLPERENFEHRIGDWVRRTRERRAEHDLARQSATIAGDRDAAQLARDVELVASESARDALQQIAGLLTTVHAHLVTTATGVGDRARTEPTLAHLRRNLDEARKAADAAILAAEGFFDGAYGSRDTSPAIVASGIRDAANIAARITKANECNVVVDTIINEGGLPIRGLSGIEFLLLMVPAIGTALSVAAESSTVGVQARSVMRVDQLLRDSRGEGMFWVNRRNALLSRPAVAIAVTAAAVAIDRGAILDWLEGRNSGPASIPARGLVGGLQKCQGLMGVADDGRFRLELVLPT